MSRRRWLRGGLSFGLFSNLFSRILFSLLKGRYRTLMNSCQLLQTISIVVHHIW
jgi:hypothetical protein